MSLILDGTAGVTGPATKVIVGTTTNDDAFAGYVGEVARALSTAVSFPATGTYGDAASISLTSGDWDVTIVGYQVANGAAVTSFGVGISSTTGNSSTGLVNGDNALSLLTPSTGAGNISFAIPNFRVSLSGTVTYYFKFTSNFTVATPQLNGRITARRVR